MNKCLLATIIQQTYFYLDWQSNRFNSLRPGPSLARTFTHYEPIMPYCLLDRKGHSPLYTKIVLLTKCSNMYMYIPQCTTLSLQRSHLNVMASQITGNSIVCSSVSFSVCQRKHQSSTSLGLCEGNPPFTGGFPSQRASNAESVSKMTSFCYDLV